MICSLINTSAFRLQYFARGLQVYIRQLRLALQGKTGEALKTDEVRILAYISLGNFYNSHHSLQIHTEFIY